MTNIPTTTTALETVADALNSLSVSLDQSLHQLSDAMARLKRIWAIRDFKREHELSDEEFATDDWQTIFTIRYGQEGA